MLKIEKDGTCKEKKELALRYKDIDVPLDGSEVEGKLTETTVHKAGP